MPGGECLATGMVRAAGFALAACAIAAAGVVTILGVLAAAAAAAADAVESTELLGVLCLTHPPLAPGVPLPRRADGGADPDTGRSRAVDACGSDGGRIAAAGAAAATEGDAAADGPTPPPPPTKPPDMSAFSVLMASVIVHVSMNWTGTQACTAEPHLPPTLSNHQKKE